jgi:hypothetical protein
MPEIISAESYPHGHKVHSNTELLNTTLHGEENVLLLPRNLTIDFQPLADKLSDAFLQEGRNDFYHAITPNVIKGTLLEIAPEEQEAIDQIMKDIAWLPNAYLQLTRRTENYGEFHIDGNHERPLAERIMCVYTGATTECIDTNDAKQHIRYQHKRTTTNDAQIYFMPHGWFWKHACEQGDAVPLVHKAPSRYRTNKRNKNRLMIVMDILS